jgi:hypothetical protein
MCVIVADSMSDPADVLLVGRFQVQKESGNNNNSEQV